MLLRGVCARMFEIILEPAELSNAILVFFKTYLQSHHFLKKTRSDMSSYISPV
jgi:hypothetical protein